jgi:2-iminoacetate synthase ThiH
MIRRRAPWLVVFVAIALISGVLGLNRTGSAAPKEEREPFANAVAQRAEMIALLKDIQAQLKEQNQLLGSGKLTVIVQTEKKEE